MKISHVSEVDYCANFKALVRGRKRRSEAAMSTNTDISVLYREFTDSLTEVLAETAGTPVRRGRLARPTSPLKGMQIITNMNIF
jgi:hypothetical protein